MNSTIPTDDEDAKWLRSFIARAVLNVSDIKPLERIADRLSTIPSAGELRDADRKAERRLREYAAWKRQPHEIDPEDAGREIEFAWGEAYDLGYAAALSIQTISGKPYDIATLVKAGQLYTDSIPPDTHNLHCRAWSELSEAEQQPWIDAALAAKPSIETTSGKGMREALEGLVEGVERHCNEQGISGYLGARLSDAKTVLAALVDQGERG